MGKRDVFWSRMPEDPDLDIRWPDDPNERAALVREAFGAQVIGALESVLEDKLAIARGERPKPGTDDYEQEAARREVFAGLSQPQRAEVARLVRSACFGTLYWILVKLESFPGGSVDFTVAPFAPGGDSYPVVGIEETELHHLYFDWLERFSDHGDA